MKLSEVQAYALQALKATGAEQYACQATEGEQREFNVDSGRFSLLRSTFDRSLELTLIKDQRRGRVAINDFDQAAIDRAVQDCLAAAESAQADAAWQMEEGDQQRFVQGVPEGDMDRLFERSRELLDTIKAEYPKISLEQMVVSHQRSHALYQNSKGADYERTAGAYGAFLMFSGHEEGKSSSFNGDGFVTDSLDRPFIELATLRQTLSDAEKQIHTVAPEGKYEGSVVFTPGCLADILDSLLNNYVADGVMLEGTSLWKDKLGEQVVDGRLSISSLPHDSRIVLGERYGQDGLLAQDYAIIEQGVLQQFMLSGYVARKIGKQRAPASGLSLVVEGGDQPLQDIIKGIRKGLLVGRFSGGSPATNGDFSGVAKNSFLIEDGQVGSAVSETMISGNLGQMMKQLRGISRETVADGFRVLPWLAVDGITVSGK